MNHFIVCTAVIGLLLLWTHHSHAHGILWDPPGRSTMWRWGFNVPPNYSDNQLFCGGLSRQINNGYRCGVCGDPWDGIRENEAGGTFATGQISKEFREGQAMTVTVNLTANHLGNSWGIEPGTSQGCLGCGPQEEFYGCSDIRIVASDQTVTSSPPDEQGAVITTSPQTSTSSGDSETQPPAGVGLSGQGSVNVGGIGLSEQVPVNTGSSGDSEQVPVNTGSSGGSGQVPGNTGSSSGSGQVPINTGSSGGSGQASLNTGTSGGSGQVPVNTRTSGGIGIPGLGGSSSGVSVNGDRIVCQGVRAGLGNWCQLNCQRGYCPATHCSCVVQQYRHETLQPAGCRGAGVYANLPGYNTWCRNNCALNNCPASLCVCT
ncbi:hypothetical protein EGW08_015194 [Elysia chlorotica]|uniref:Uncharacterized protein n=1 Tax=Elysia chlorotica TaxID=188477 RepID=A0A3S1HDA3_ELYCH|nr:hypothetical protein EGW08_015194 [Elysia chlorotica]